MDKNDQQILVVKKNVLFRDDYFQGFKAISEVDYESRILKNFEYMKRGLAENKPLYKQPIGYVTIVNPELKKIFTYQRSVKDEEYYEKRLQGKISWGVGGHIEKVDAENGNIIHSSILRELEEEVEIKGSIKLRVLGYINDDSDDVGKVHFGILYLVETNAKTIRPKDPEVCKGDLKSIQDLERICSSKECNVDNWSKIALDPLKRYLKSLSKV